MSRFLLSLLMLATAISVGGQSVPAGVNTVTSPAALNALTQLPITAVPFASSVNSSAYVANLFALQNTTVPGAATLTPLTPDNFQPMYGNGMSVTRITLEPCALLETHVHPRGTELLVVLLGNLTVGHATEDMRSFTSNLTTLDYTIFPKGLAHFYLNSGCTATTFDLILNDENAGIAFLKAAYSAFDAQTQQTIGSLGNFTAPAVANADSRCAARCGRMTSPTTAPSASSG